jgi:hypothetical protein
MLKGQSTIFSLMKLCSKRNSKDDAITKKILLLKLDEPLSKEENLHKLDLDAFRAREPLPFALPPNTTLESSIQESVASFFSQICLKSHLACILDVGTFRSSELS